MSKSILLLAALISVAFAQQYCGTGGEALFCKDPVDGKCRLCPGTKYVTSCVNDKQYALTFDDGPFPSTTSNLLQVLDAKNVKATFFICGNQLSIPTNVATLQQTYQKGHIIAAHSLKHKSYTGLSDNSPPMTAQQIRDDAGEINRLIYNAIGKYPRYMRPPYGDRNDFSYGVLTSAPVCYDRVIIWNIDSNDAKPGYTENSAMITQWVQQNLASPPAPMTTSASSFIHLQHDLRQVSIDSVAGTIDAIRAAGYTLVDMPTCMGEADKSPYQDEKSACRTEVIKTGSSSTLIVSGAVIVTAAIASLLA
jgi:peptidoglycan/xylan/chitin deacetylase (PgdA/CDA1 family)